MLLILKQILKKLGLNLLNEFKRLNSYVQKQFDIKITKSYLDTCISLIFSGNLSILKNMSNGHQHEKGNKYPFNEYNFKVVIILIC